MESSYHSMVSNPDNINKQLKLLWVAVGNEDFLDNDEIPGDAPLVHSLQNVTHGTEEFLYESVKKNIALFHGKNKKLKIYIVPGGHTWMNCKLFPATL